MYDFNYRTSLILHLAVLLVLCGLLFFSSLSRIPFFNKGEPREAIVVQKILLDGHWLFPLRAGNEIPSKPPLFHWVGALVSLAWGKATEATVRLPSALFAAMSVIALYLLGRRIFAPPVALLGGVLLATSVGFQGEAIAARVDMTLAFFVTVTLILFYSLFAGYLKGEAAWYLFYLLLGIGVLAKGPVGLILPGMVIAAFLLLQKRWDLLSRFAFHKGVLLTLIIPVSWYGLALIRGGEGFYDRQILHENLARFFVHGEGGTGHQKPFYYLFPYLIAGGLPWTLLLPFVAIDWFRKKTFRENGPLFLMLWAGLVLLFFSVSAGKRSDYLLPLYPPLSLLIGLWLGRAAERDWVRRFGFQWVGGISLLIALLFLAMVLAQVAGRGPFWFLSWVAGLLKPKDQAQLMAVQEALIEERWMVSLFLFLSGLIWLSTARQWFAMNSQGAVVRLALVSLLTGLWVQGVVMPAVAEPKSYKPFMVEAMRRVGQNGTLAIYGQGWDFTSALFYAGGRVPIVNELPASVREQRALPTHYIMSEAEWKKRAAQGSFDFGLELRSRGAGPDDADPIVLVKDLRPAKERP